MVMSADLQAKYNALLRIYSGEDAMVLPSAILASVRSDIDHAREDLLKRRNEQIKKNEEARKAAGPNNSGYLVVAPLCDRWNGILPPSPKVTMDVSHTPDESIMVIKTENGWAK